MIQLTDTPFVIALAEVLPDFAYIIHYDHPRLHHLPSGMILSISRTWNHQRLAFTPVNVSSSLGVYTVSPPTITLAAQRPLTAIAGAISRRLLPKALPWYHAACAWRDLRLAEDARKAEISRLIAAVGGGALLETNDRYSQMIYAHRWGAWRATVHADGTVSLALTRLDYETALTVLEVLHE